MIVICNSGVQLQNWAFYSLFLTSLHQKFLKQLWHIFTQNNVCYNVYFDVLVHISTKNQVIGFWYRMKPVLSFSRDKLIFLRTLRVWQRDDGFIIFVDSNKNQAQESYNAYYLSVESNILMVVRLQRNAFKASFRITFCIFEINLPQTTSCFQTSLQFELFKCIEHIIGHRDYDAFRSLFIVIIIILQHLLVHAF